MRYRILGDGPHRESILFAIHDLGLEQHVELPGARRADDVRDALGWADVCLHPAISEGFCVSVIEAQAMGLPVVCTDADGLGENVADGVTGFVVPRRDAGALASGLAELASRPGLRERWAQPATRRAHERFGFDRQLDALETLYRAALALPAPVPAGERHDAPALIETLERQLNALEVQRAGAGEAAARAGASRTACGARRRGCPAGATVLVVSRGDDELIALEQRVGWHFPQARGRRLRRPPPGRQPRSRSATWRSCARAARTHLVIPGDVGVVAGALRRLPRPPRRSATCELAADPRLRRVIYRLCVEPADDRQGAHDAGRALVSRRRAERDREHAHGRVLRRDRVPRLRRDRHLPRRDRPPHRGAARGERARSTCSTSRTGSRRSRSGCRAGRPSRTSSPTPTRGALMDSYNWSLMQLLAEHGGRCFDYVFLDGAHTWALDALAFLLVDRLLTPGGYVDFDDYGWTTRALAVDGPAGVPQTCAGCTATSRSNARRSRWWSTCWCGSTRATARSSRQDLPQGRRLTAVSVCIPTRNQARSWARRCESALAQDVAAGGARPRRRARTTTPAAVLAAVRDPRRAGAAPRRARWGSPRTATRCSSHARGRYVAWLDSDDAYLPGSLAAHASHVLEAHPRVGLVHARLPGDRRDRPRAARLAGSGRADTSPARRRSRSASCCART